VESLVQARVLVADRVKREYAIDPVSDRWRKVPKGSGNGWAAVGEWEEDLFPCENLQMAVANAAAAVVPAHVGANRSDGGGGESGRRMSVPDLVAEMRAAAEGKLPVVVPDSGTEASGIRYRNPVRAAPPPKLPTNVGVPDSGTYTLRTNVLSETFNVTFKGLSDTGQHAVMELMRFLGERELRRYQRDWLGAAQADPDRLLEHARWLLDKERTGFAFKHRGKYAWGIWKQSFGLVRAGK
jgi:hypothetical protein